MRLRSWKLSVADLSSSSGMWSCVLTLCIAPVVPSPDRLDGSMTHPELSCDHGSGLLLSFSNGAGLAVRLFLRTTKNKQSAANARTDAPSTAESVMIKTLLLLARDPAATFMISSPFRKPPSPGLLLSDMPMLTVRFPEMGAVAA
jgi:hypothetical protein